MSAARRANGTALAMLVVIVVGAPALVGCGVTFGEECTWKEQKCVDGVAWYCDEGYAWQQTPCAPGFCVLGSSADEGRPFCALSPDVDDACPASGEGQGCADDATLIECHESHRISAQRCDLDRTCVRTPLGEFPPAVCALSAKPDARCPHDGAGGFCFGNVLVACAGGYIVEIEDCGGETCVEQIDAKIRRVSCRHPETSDPACADGAGALRCVDGRAILCHGTRSYGDAPCADCRDPVLSGYWDNCGAVGR